MDQTAPRDDSLHPPADRGEDTRQRLLDAALHVFGRDGYDGVSTRRIAALAGANVAAIAYHFGGKRGLYLAVARAVADRNAAILAPMEHHITQAVCHSQGDPVALGRVLGRVVARMMAGLGSAREDGRAAFLVRELMMPSDAFDILYDAFFLPMNRALSAIAGAALGRPPDDPQSVMRGHLVFGAVMPLIAGRVVVERRLACDILSDDTRPATLAAAVASACGSLGLPVPDVATLED